MTDAGRLEEIRRNHGPRKCSPETCNVGYLLAEVERLREELADARTMAHGPNRIFLAERSALKAEVERLRGLLLELDGFEFYAAHKPGCGDPCDCGWDDLDRRLMAELEGKG